MNTLPYLQYITLDTNIQSGSLSYLEKAKELHIFAPNLVALPRIKNKKVYVYVFNIEQYELVKQANYIPHICIIDDNLIDNELLSVIDSNLELFWFPTDKVFNEINKYSDYLVALNLPVCISYSPFIQSEVITEDFRQFVKNIHTSFNNPLYNKEKSLLVSDVEGLYNYALLQEDGILYLKNIVLGLFGDCLIEDKNQYELINKKSILKNLECMQCTYSEYCLNKGIGYIMSKNKYKGCIGIKLMQPSEDNV